jgi:hypothetical protein
MSKDHRPRNLGQIALVDVYHLAGNALESLSAADRQLSKHSAYEWAQDTQAELRRVIAQLHTFRETTLQTADVYPSEVP